MEPDVCSETMGGPAQEQQEDTNASERSTLLGKRFTVSWSAGDVRPVLSWNCKYVKYNPARGDTLLPSAMQYLAQYCLPHIVDAKLQCHTEFLSSAGQKYRANPNIYDGKAWHDDAMVTSRGYKYPLSALIHIFVDLRSPPPPEQGLSYEKRDSHLSKLEYTHSYIALTPLMRKQQESPQISW